MCVYWFMSYVVILNIHIKFFVYFRIFFSVLLLFTFFYICDVFFITPIPHLICVRFCLFQIQLAFVKCKLCCWKLFVLFVMSDDACKQNNLVLSTCCIVGFSIFFSLFVYAHRWLKICWMLKWISKEILSQSSGYYYFFLVLKL